VSKEIFGNFRKESSDFKEEKYEIAKNFEGLGQISNFRVLKSPRSLEDLSRFLTFFF
jgi:ERCC4-type nuclease